MRNRTSRGALAFVLLLGCGGAQTRWEAEAGDEETYSAPAPTRVVAREAPPQQAPPPTCPPELAELDQTLRTLSGVAVRNVTALPLAAEAPSATAGPVLEVTAGSIVLDGEPVDARGLARRLGELQERAQQAGTDAPAHVLIAAAADVPASTLSTLLSRVPAAWRVQLLTRSAAQSVDPSAECPALQETLDRAVGACDAARDTIRALASPAICPDTPEPSGEPGEAPSLVEQLQACGCDGVDLTAVGSAMRHRYELEHASYAYSLDAASGGRVNLRAFRLARTATVQDLVERLAAAQPAPQPVAASQAAPAPETAAAQQVAAAPEPTPSE